jgi:hypothetical protein
MTTDRRIILTILLIGLLIPLSLAVSVDTTYTITMTNNPVVYQIDYGYNVSNVQLQSYTI